MSENKKVIVYRKKWKMNVGIILFGTLFIYLIILIISYATRNHVDSYEVHMGRILNDENYTGMAIREEKVVLSDKDGYIKYSSTENRKVKKGEKICAMSSEKFVNQTTGNFAKEKAIKSLTEEQQNSLSLTVQSFTNNFSDSNFSEVYSFKETIKNTLSDFSSDENDFFNKISNSTPEDFLLKSEDDGVIVYNTDGYESFTEEQIRRSNFDRQKYYVKELNDNMKISSGEPICKLITSENWSVAIPITERTAKELKDRTMITVRFLKDDEKMVGNLFVKKQENQYMAYIHFSSGMIRYANERFLDLELIFTDYSGLKIPKSAIVEKPFFVIPTEYIVKGGNSNETGVLKKSSKNKNTVEFVPLDVYSEKDQLSYVDLSELNKGDIIIKPDSNMTHIIGETKKLSGVYQINKGYAIFKQVEILCERKEFYIVQAKNEFGLSNYDHIALYGKKIKENDIIVQ
ncbi:HlyD family efflux transporter periplasmic adaptor subunit [Faecalimonas sp.]